MGLRIIFGWLLLALMAPGTGWSQTKKDTKTETGKAVSDIPKGAVSLILETEDGAYLSATYWPAKKGGKEVGVVIIPCIRGGSQREWYSMAQQLHDLGLAVITFDFRGFGQSLTFGPNAKTSSKKDGNQIRSADILRNAESMKPLLLDLDCIKQFLLRENNQGSLNIRQSGILAFGDLATVISFNWLIDREFSTKHTYTHEKGDIAAVCLVAPALKMKNYIIPSRLPAIPERVAFYLVSASDKSASGEACERLARHLKVPVIEGTASEKKEADRRNRPGGWKRVSLNSKKKGADLTIDFLRIPEFQKERDGVAGFLNERLKFQKNAPWEGERDTDQAFHIVTSSK